MNKSYKRYWSMLEIRKVEIDMELLEKVLSKEKLNKAYKRVYNNKGVSGIDGVTGDELFSLLDYILIFFFFWGITITIF